MHFLALPNIVDACIINLITLPNGSAVRAASHRCVLLFADKFLIVCAIHSMMVQILRLVEAAALWIQQAAELGRWRAVFTHHLKLNFAIDKLPRLRTRQMRACATH